MKQIELAVQGQPTYQAEAAGGQSVQMSIKLSERQGPGGAA